MGDTGVQSDGAWGALASVTWRFDGVDRRASRAEVPFRLRAVEGRAQIVGIGGSQGRVPVWLSGAMHVRRADGVLVLAATQDAADRLTALAGRSLRTVRRVLPAWRGGLVVEAPASAAHLERAVGAALGDYQQIAAVTGSPDGTVDRSAPFHVFVNPEQFDSLDALGRRVVLAHEAAHVATGAPASRAPLWLVEGFADYVALRDERAPLATTAAQIAAQVRESGAPRGLPSAAEFDSTAAHLGAVYESAWLACRVIAEWRSEVALVQLYRRASRGVGLGPALARIGATESELTRRWRGALVALAP
ncbi:basic secretory family protein [Nocardioides sp. R-C-SC26]|uniref:basic secretory family protein n=1 Tax=Nocardioides sp. R-C-SC26 TaxID=2870414 RepID=UPI001E55EBBF|nr:basic secretory family protein [Nocardioides sp. R-C-SC26]